MFGWCVYCGVMMCGCYGVLMCVALSGWVSGWASEAAASGCGLDVL